MNRGLSISVISVHIHPFPTILARLLALNLERAAGQRDVVAGLETENDGEE